VAQLSRAALASRSSRFERLTKKASGLLEVLTRPRRKGRICAKRAGRIPQGLNRLRKKARIDFGTKWVLQGLKQGSFAAFDGTTEVVPDTKALTNCAKTRVFPRPIKAHLFCAIYAGVETPAYRPDGISAVCQALWARSRSGFFRWRLMLPGWGAQVILLDLVEQGLVADLEVACGRFAIPPGDFQGLRDGGGFGPILQVFAPDA